MRTQDKEEIIEHYLYQLQEKFEWSLHNKDFNSDDIETILRDMYEIEISKKTKLTKEKILKCKHDIFMRFDKESTYRELGEGAAREIVSHALDILINELDREEDITNENRTS